MGASLRVRQISAIVRCQKIGLSTNMASRRTIASYEHRDKERLNNPPVGLAQQDMGSSSKIYAYDPNLDPQLDWAGKTEGVSFQVPTVSLHVHERIDPRSLASRLLKDDGTSRNLQPSLFESQVENPPLRRAIEFYQHSHNWSNRLIAGDSLLVMNSLLEKEGMAEKVQMVYMDPPYGIRYGSNFQPFVNRKEVKDGKDDDLASEPETIKAFRDTWELGIHSYLNYLRDRLLLARALLHASGSIFVQIGDENVHRVSLLLDDIFGFEQRVATISFATSSGSSTSTLPQVADYLLWYAKDKSRLKYRQIYEQLTRKELIEFFSSYVMVELSDGSCRKLTDEERFDPDQLPAGSRIYRRTGLTSQGASTTGRSEPYLYNGRIFSCPEMAQWAISGQGLDRLAELKRLDASDKGKSLHWKKYENEVPGRRINNIWRHQAYPRDKKYVVETATKIIQRCLLMTTDPGDLVLDPTCGSGTTAYVSEEWGRRWVTCDTSRVAIAIAKQRLMTANFPYFALAHEEEGVGSGFQYATVPQVSPKTLGYDEPAKHITLFDAPLEDSGKKRVSGPFTYEAVPAPTVMPLAIASRHQSLPADDSVARAGETLRHSEWRDELLKTGIRGRTGKTIYFSRLETLAGLRYLQAEGELILENEETAEKDARVLVTFGPEYAPLEQRQVELALQEAENMRPKPKMIIFAAFQFDPEASKDIDEMHWPGVTLLKVQMNADLLTDDLKKRRSSNESFLLIGQPEIEVTTTDGDNWLVKVLGFDYYNPQSGAIESGGRGRIAMWMLDPDYDGRSLFPQQVFFPLAGSQEGWNRLARNLRAGIDLARVKAYEGTVSQPFQLGGGGATALLSKSLMIGGLKVW